MSVHHWRGAWPALSPAPHLSWPIPPRHACFTGPFFARQSRLAITLAWVAGYTNIVALLICGVAVSHMTGTASQWGPDVVRGRWGLVAFTSFMLAAFVAGAAIATRCIEFEPRRRRSLASIAIWLRG